MCDPVTVLTVSSAALGAFSSFEQGRSAKAAARFNEREQQNEATRTRNKGVEEENKHRQKVAQLASKQRAQIGAAGIDLNSGSALALQEDTQLLGEVDSLRIRKNFSDTADSLDRGAELTRSEGDAAGRAGTFGAIGSLVAGGSKVASKWYTPTSQLFSTSSTGIPSVSGTPLAQTGLPGTINF